MAWRDFLWLALRALIAHRLRSFLTLLGIAVGIAAVILLTSIGEGLHRYMLAEFTQFGTNIIGIAPGRQGVGGGPPGVPNTARELTLEDAAALERLPNVTGVTPVVFGNTEVQGNGRVRRTAIHGVSSGFVDVVTIRVGSGRFLPPDDPAHARAFVVLGAKLKRELFGEASALGERVRIGGERYRVIGVMEEKGQVLGFDMDDMAYIPAGRAMALFRLDGLLEIDVSYAKGVPAASVAADIRRVLGARHGREDFTLTTQEDMLRTLSNILGILTLAVGALGGISLAVGAVGIVTIMTIAVAERTNEIGLLIALGARRATVLALFLAEAVLLSVLGGTLGLAIGVGIAQLVGLLAPALPVGTPWQFVVLAELTAASIGLVAGVLPAQRAAGLDPVDALRTE